MITKIGVVIKADEIEEQIEPKGEEGKRTKGLSKKSNGSRYNSKY